MREREAKGRQVKLGWSAMSADDQVDPVESLRLLVLQALRLKGLATGSVVATIYDLDPGDVGRELDALGQQDLVVHRDLSGSGARWSLTPAGRAEGERLVRAELERLPGRGERSARQLMTDLYERFLPLNRAILDLCTRWQVRCHDPVQLNDHSDAHYDAAIIVELGEIDGQVRKICDELATMLPRFGRYGRGFEYALGRIRNGAVEWFTKPTIASYHTLWFEYHEDLLATLGLDRAAETAQQAGAT